MVGGIRSGLPAAETILVIGREIGGPVGEGVRGVGREDADRPIARRRLAVQHGGRSACHGEDGAVRDMSAAELLLPLAGIAARWELLLFLATLLSVIAFGIALAPHDPMVA